MMKNILYLHAGAEMYGADKILLEVVNGLDRKKYYPIVILPNNGVLVDALKKINVEVYVVDYPILRRKYFNFIGIISYIFRYFSKTIEVYKMIHGRNISIIHVNTTAVLEGISLKRMCHAKLLWHVHEIIEKPKFINRVICYFLSKYADQIVTVSQATKAHIIDSGMVNPNNIKIVYNGVDDNHIELCDCKYLFDEFNVTEYTKKIGMIGRINSWKGQKDFVDSVVPILEKYDDSMAFIIGGVFEGEEWLKKDLIKYINKTTVSDKIILSDFRSDTQYLFKFFNVFVVPSIRPDPLPTVVLEAMSSGRPIVGYDHGGISEMIIDQYNGYLIEPRNTKQMSDKICDLLNDKDKMKKYGNNSLKLQKKYFSISRFNLAFDEVYSSL